MNENVLYVLLINNKKHEKNNKNYIIFHSSPACTSDERYNGMWIMCKCVLRREMHLKFVQAYLFDAGNQPKQNNNDIK